MLVVSRLSLPDRSVESVQALASPALQALSARPGFLSGRLARATDDPAQWVLVLEYDSVGAYRRALSAYDVKVHTTPLLALAVDEVSAYEVLLDAAAGTSKSDRADG